MVILDQILAVADPSEVLGGQIGLGLGENQIAGGCVTKVFMSGKKVATEQAFMTVVWNRLQVFLSSNRD